MNPKYNQPGTKVAAQGKKKVTLIHGFHHLQ